MGLPLGAACTRGGASATVCAQCASEKDRRRGTFYSCATGPRPPEAERRHERTRGQTQRSLKDYLRFFERVVPFARQETWSALVAPERECLTCPRGTIPQNYLFPGHACPRIHCSLVGGATETAFLRSTPLLLAFHCVQRAAGGRRRARGRRRAVSSRLSYLRGATGCARMAPLSHCTSSRAVCGYSIQAESRRVACFACRDEGASMPNDDVRVRGAARCKRRRPSGKRGRVETGASEDLRAVSWCSDRDV
jgi:hypothetical protein